MVVDKQLPPLKPMRLGTRSCRECRRRKIKCIWPEATSNICTPCSRNTRECVSQDFVPTSDSKIGKRDRPAKYSLRVIPFEPIVGRLAKQQQLQIPTPDVYKNVPKDIGNLPDEIRHLKELNLKAEETSPILVLFNNDLVTQVKKTPASSLEPVQSINFENPGLSDLEKLQSTIADEPNILDVLDVAASWFISWRGASFVTNNGAAPRTLRAFVTGLLQQSDPVVYALGLLCIATSLQHLHIGEDDAELHLSNSPPTLFGRINTVVDQVVLDSVVYLCDPQCIIPLLQRAKLHAEDNQLRKSWSRSRQAVILAQHTHFAAPDSSLPDQEIKQRQQLVGQLLELDRFLSMVMGFPHAFDENFKKDLALSVLRDSKIDTVLRMRALRRVLAVLAGEVNDRNSKPESLQNVAVTNSIQQELDQAYAAMPTEWWDLESHLDDSDAQATHEHLKTQLWFWNIQSYLQLPYMLAMSHKSEFKENSDLCMKACYKMLEVFCAIRSSPSQTILLCNCDDFQAVLITCTLIISLLLRTSSDTAINPADLKRYLGILSDVKDIFRYRSGQQECTISKKGLKVMETLESFLHDQAGGRDTEKDHSIILPYFGMIQIHSAISPRSPTNIEWVQNNEPVLTPNTSNGTSFESTPGDFPGHALFDDLENGNPNIEIDNTFKTTDINWNEWDQFMYGTELEKEWFAQ